MKYIYHFHALTRYPLKAEEGLGVLDMVQHHDGLIDANSPITTAEEYNKLKDEIAAYASTTRDKLTLTSLSYMGCME